MLPNKALASIKITTCEFLIFYKKTNTIAVIPTPTVHHNLQPVLNEINGPPPLGATAQPSQPTAAANATVAAPAAVATMPTAQAGAKASMITPFGFQFGGQVNAVAGINSAASTPDSCVFSCNPYVGSTITTPASTHAAGGFVMALVMYDEEAQGNFNQHIANLQAGNINGSIYDDNKMLDTGEMQQPAAIIGGRSTIRQQLLFLIQQTIMNLIKELHCLHKMKEKLRHTEGAILPTQLSDAAQWIAVVVQAKCPIDHPVLCELVREHADKLVEEVKQRLQSIEKKLANKHHLNAKCGCPTTQKNARGDGKSKTNPPKSILRKMGPAAAVTMPTKTKKTTGCIKTPPPTTGQPPTSPNWFAALANNNNNGNAAKKRRGRNRRRSSSTLKRNGRSTSRSK